MPSNPPDHERPSEAAILAAVARLGGGVAFQQLADDFLRRWKLKYRDLTPYGRSPDATNNRWPDSYVDRNGHVYLVEATNDRGRQKVTDDIRKAHERVSAFAEGEVAEVIVVSGRAIPRPEDISKWRSSFNALGITLVVVTPTKLALELRDGRFAQLWRTLNLRYHVRPFHILRTASFLHPQRHDPRPTLEELEDTLDQSGPTALSIERQLGSSRCAIVRSAGGAGKTILAAHLGLRHERGGGASYYLDLSSDLRHQDARERAIDSLVEFADRDVLFIVDNIHLDESFVYDLAAAWKAFGNSSTLLLCGQRGLDRGDMVEKLLNVSASELKVRDDDLRAIYSRLARRIAGDDAPLPPHRIPKSWRRVQDDLVLFSAAISNRLETIIATHNFDIEPADAHDEVRRRYLFDASRVPALVTVATLTALELLTPDDVIDRGLIEKSAADGAVERLEIGRRSFYRLTHPRLARLLLEAAERPATDWEALRAAIDRRPALAWAIARRLDRSVQTRGQRTLAELLSQVWDRCSSVEWHLPSRLPFIQNAISRALELEVAQPATIDGFLASHHKVLLGSVANSTGSEALDFLNFIERFLPATDLLMLAALRSKGVRAPLWHALQVGSLGDLDRATTYFARRDALADLIDEFVAVADARTAEYWDDAFSRTTAQELLDITQHGSDALRGLLTRSMKTPSRAESLLRSLRSQSTSRQTILVLIESAGHDPALAAATLDSLGDLFEGPLDSWESATQLLEEAGGFARQLVPPLVESFAKHMDELPFTIDDVRALLAHPQGRSVVNSLLRRPDARAQIGTVLALSDLDRLQGLFASVTSLALRNKLAQAIPIEDWRKGRQQHETNPWNWRHVSRVLSEAGRGDLDELLARELLARTDPELWKRQDAFPSLVRVLLSSTVAPAEYMPLVDAIASEDFIARSYVEGRGLALAVSFLAVWGHLPDLVERFSGPHLANRARRAVIASGTNARDTITTIALIGASDLKNERIAPPASLQAANLTAIVEAMIAEAASDRLRYDHIIFWAGLRASGRASSAVRTAMNNSDIERALRLWRTSSAPTERLETLRVGIIDWIAQFP
jgi:hypothetical protein